LTLRKVIKIVEYSNLTLLFGLFAGVLIVVFNSDDGKFLIFELLFAVPFILTFFFRKALIRNKLGKTRYPGALYAVLDKMLLTHKLDIELTDEMLNEMYKPAYSTSEFLADNELETEIGEKKVSLAMPILSTVASVTAFIYFSSRINFGKEPFLLISFLAFVAISIFSWLKLKKQKNDGMPVLMFKETGLHFHKDVYPWKSIYDWNVQPGGRNESDYFIISYYDEAGNIHETFIHISNLNIDKIEFLLLMTHFKGKYGN